MKAKVSLKTHQGKDMIARQMYSENNKAAV